MTKKDPKAKKPEKKSSSKSLKKTLADQAA